MKLLETTAISGKFKENFSNLPRIEITTDNSSNFLKKLRINLFMAREVRLYFKL